MAKGMTNECPSVKIIDFKIQNDRNKYLTCCDTW